MTENTATAVPMHRRPGSCYVCGGSDHGDTFTRTGRGHNFWANSDAAAYFKAEDARPLRVIYSTGETTAEGNYVAQTRGR